MTNNNEVVTKTVQAGAHTIAFTELGQGEPLICLHGGGAGASGMSNFSRNIEALAGDRRVILMDLPGYGGSSLVKPEGPRLKFFAASLLAFMDALDVRQADLVGNSLGGATAVKLALESPERVNRLVLMGPAVGFPVFSPFPTEGWKHMARYYAPPGPTVEKMRDLIGIMVHDPSQVTDQLVQARFEDSARPEVVACQPGPPTPESPFEQLWTELSRVHHETLLIWGRDDRVVPFDMALVILQQLRNSQMHVFTDCGHWTQWEKADAFNAVVNTFLG